MATKTADSVFLKLVFDADEAKKTAGEVNKSLNESREHAENVSKSFQATVHGRLLSGLASSVRGTLGAVFNDEMPKAIAEAELKIAALGAAAGAAGGEKAGAMAEAAGRLAYKGDLTAARNTFDSLQALQNVFPEEALDEKDVHMMYDVMYKQHQKVYSVNQQLRANIDGNPNLPSLRMDPQSLKQGIGRMGSAVAGATTDLVQAVPGMESFQDWAADKIAGFFGWD